MSQCVCELAGWCEKAKRHHSPHTHGLCERREDYRRLFWKLPPQEKKKDEPKPPCVHRGADTRQVECLKCGPNRGKLVQLFRCLHEHLGGKEVSEQLYWAGQPRNETCHFCKSYEPENA